jgi:transglutaminase-like putative cysteine protease
MRYTIRHTTRFTYDAPISESVMEVRMQPRSEWRQRCVNFGLSTTPASRVMMYQDHEGNLVHHFNIPGRHARLTVTAQSLVESAPADSVPDSLGANGWARLDAMTATGEYWELMNPSTFIRSTERLEDFAQDIDLRRGDDPLVTLRRLNAEVFTRFDYRPQTTRVDSPIDDALETRKGVCQDFAHIMIALARRLGIPCRYVSGYLFHAAGSTDRSGDGATHAWVEAVLPELGWVGFDPTNNLIAADRHIRVATGRDYADVPPTRGVYKGHSNVSSELAVAVRVGPAQPPAGDVSFVPWVSREVEPPVADDPSRAQSQQQQ